MTKRLPRKCLTPSPRPTRSPRPPSRVRARATSLASHLLFRLGPKGRQRDGKRRLLLLAAVLALCVLGACGTRSVNPPLRVAALPILDALPLYVADESGLFEAAGVDVELVPVSSAAERDQLLQAGQVEVVITDLVALALANRDARRLIAIRYAMVPTETRAQFGILAAPGAFVRSPLDLAGKAIGVSEGTIVEYVTDRMLAGEGLVPDQITMLAVPAIPDRMALLAGDGLAAATLPEPFASVAVQQGARIVVDDRAYTDLSCSVYAVTDVALDTVPEAVARLITAIDDAIELINEAADAEAVTDAVAIAERLLPRTLVGNYALPRFPDASVPSAAQYVDAAAWLRETERLEASAPYEDVVSDAFVD